MELEDALRRCGGAARWSRLRALGVSEHALKTGLASGRVKAAGNGGYALLDAEPAIAPLFLSAASSRTRQRRSCTASSSTCRRRSSR